jgi:hypothetical protein
VPRLALWRLRELTQFVDLFGQCIEHRTQLVLRHVRERPHILDIGR